MKRLSALVLAACCAGSVAMGTAPVGANPFGPPTVAFVAPPDDSGPPGRAEQRTRCAVPVAAGRVTQATRTVRSLLDVDRLHRISTGGGQTVAIIDTGVTAHPRLPPVRDGGDYVTGSGGRSDCDAHGTLVAGLIAARPSGTDDFVGLAPDVALVSIRQSSAAFSPPRRADDRAEATVGSGYGSVASLAAAVMRAVRLGATVVNISEVACSPSSARSTLGDAGLGAALRHAVDRDVVVVVAAGNVSGDGGCREQNPAAGRAQRWSAVRTVATPAWFSDYVLTVGSVDSTTGMPSPFSLAGPWVSIAAPGTDLTSLDSRPGRSGLVSGITASDGAVPISGTSFAAAYVTATVALVRARHPELNARAVMNRITATATGRGDVPDARVGYGLVDPLAALTAEIPASEGVIAERFRPAPPPPARSSAPLIVAVGGGIALVVALAVALGCLRPRHRITPFDDGL